MSSEPFKIIVECDPEPKKDFHIHSGLLASLSPALDALVNGGMRETQEKCVTWKMQHRHFACFMSFAYTGRYDASNPCLPSMAEHFKPDCTVVEVFGYLDQTLMHIELMIFADYRDIQSLYSAALRQLKIFIKHFQGKYFITSATIAMIQVLGERDTPVRVLRDMMQVLVEDIKLLWEHKGFRESLDKWPDLKSEFLNVVMSKMGSNTP